MRIKLNLPDGSEREFDPKMEQIKGVLEECLALIRDQNQCCLGIPMTSQCPTCRLIMKLEKLIAEI